MSRTIVNLFMASGLAALICAHPALGQEPPLPPTTQPTTQPAIQPGADDSNPPADGFDLAGSDARAIELADAVMKKMGGREAWDATRYITWDFFGRRRHIYDKHTGTARIDGTDRESGKPYVVVLNVNSNDGRAWIDGKPVENAEQVQAMIQDGLGAWINDGYWLLMPYKLKDSGVTLKHLGSRAMLDGCEAEVLELTFTDVGRTPQNKYHVYIAKDTMLVEQWDFFATRDDAEPRFQVPWADWKKYGRILLSGDRGEGRTLTDIAVFDELPATVFTEPALDWDALMPSSAEPAPQP